MLRSAVQREEPQQVLKHFVTASACACLPVRGITDVTLSVASSDAAWPTSQTFMISCHGLDRTYHINHL